MVGVLDTQGQTRASLGKREIDACVVFVWLRQSSAQRQELLEMELVLGLRGEPIGEFEMCAEAGLGTPVSAPCLFSGRL